jgi:hypothetical protein
MAVNVCLPLFGHAGHELEEGSAVTGEQLRTFADELRERLRKAGDLLDRLAASGWSARVTMYDAFLSRADVQTHAEAERQLQALGVDPAELMIIEEVEEEGEGLA